LKALLWFFGVGFAYLAGQTLGILVHLICAGNATLAGELRDDAYPEEQKQGW